MRTKQGHHSTKDAYIAGWAASRRTRTFDLDAAEARYEARHGSHTGSAFAAGWVDYASDYDKFTNLPTAARVG